MIVTLSQRMRDAIREVQRDAKDRCAVLDVYEAAQRVQRTLPQENVALEDIVTAILSNHSMGFEAFEFNMRRMIIEVVVGEPNGEVDAQAA